MDVSIDKAIKVSGSNVELGEALSERSRSSLSELAAKFFGRITSGAVHYARDGVEYRCTVTMQCGGIPRMSGEGHHKDPYAALALGIGKLEAQLRRTKRELHDHKTDHRTRTKGMPEAIA
jgi:ribosomal subunit interface protein